MNTDITEKPTMDCAANADDIEKVATRIILGLDNAFYNGHRRLMLERLEQQSKNNKSCQ